MRVACEELTPRESEIYNFILKGYKDKDIASELCITEATVKKHKEHIIDKKMVDNKIGLLVQRIEELEGQCV